MGVIEKQSIQDIADAIRDRNGLTTLYKPRQMDEAIRGLYKTEAVNHIFDNLTISTTAQGTSFTITDADTTKQAKITEMLGDTIQEGTPTPETPVEIETVSGDNNIVVSNKNLLPTIDWSGTKNGCPIALSSNNTFSSNGTGSSRVLLGIDLIGGATANYGIYTNANARKITLQAGTYTLSISNVQGTLENVGENFFAVTKYREGQSTGLAIKQTNFDSMPMTFTLAEETEVFFAYQVQYTSANNYSFNFMLEKGTQATSYIAHQGNSYRVDLGGKNLITSANVINSNNVVNTHNADGSITSIGTPNGSYFYFTSPTDFYLPAGTYTFSIKNIRSYLTALELNGDSKETKYIGVGNTSITFTTTNNKNKFHLWSYAKNGTPLNETIYFQLEQGSQATPYSPYTDNPIELCKIGEYQDKILQSEGKNLLDNSTFEKGRLDNGAIGYQDGTTSLQATSNSISFTTNTIYRGVASGFISTMPESNWVFSFQPSTTVSLYIDYYDRDKTYISRISQSMSGNAVKTFTTVSNCYYMRISFQLASARSITINSLQLEQGDQATSPEPYGVGKWYIEKQVGKVVLNGTEDITTNPNGTNSFYVPISDTVYKNATTINIASNYFKGVKYNDRVIGGNNIIYVETNQNKATIRNTTFSSLENFKTWLTSNNVTVYYVLATPTTEEITDSYLLEQLNNILDIELYENLCYVDWIGIEKPTMNLRYYVDTDKILEKLREE